MIEFICKRIYRKCPYQSRIIVPCTKVVYIHIQFILIFLSPKLIYVFAYYFHPTQPHCSNKYFPTGPPKNNVANEISSIEIIIIKVAFLLLKNIGFFLMTFSFRLFLSYILSIKKISPKQTDIKIQGGGGEQNKKIYIILAKSATGNAINELKIIEGWFEGEMFFRSKLYCN